MDSRAAGLIAGLRHPHIVTIHEAGVVEGAAFIAMEYLDGETLADAIVRGTLSMDERIVVLIQILEALTYAHAQGVVHAAITPACVQFLPDRTVKLLGFEISRHESSADRLLRKAPHYLSPEQIEGNDVDVRSDIYAVGAVAYELFSGRRPYDGDSAAAVGLAVLDARLGSIENPWTASFADFERVVRRALARRPVDRFTTAADMRQALVTLRESVRSTVSMGLPAPAPARSPESAVGSGSETTLLHPPTNIGHFRIQAVLSADECDTLYRALDQTSERTVSLRIMHPRAHDGAKDAPTSRAQGPAVSTPAQDGSPRHLDDNVQFTVYRPTVVRPEQWYSLLAFAHLSERPPDASSADPDPVVEVQRQARQILGPEANTFRATTQDSLAAVPREGALTFIPAVPDVEFNPPSRQFNWTETVHREEFRLRAAASLEGRSLRGVLGVYLGSILLAEVALVIRVTTDVVVAPNEAATARPYRNIFASYSHRDKAVVKEFEAFASALGDRYLRDVVDLRSGEVWNERLLQFIEQADVFQLFWSRNAMVSPNVRKEWEYALALNRPNFVRPVFWESPFPKTPDLPPPNLHSLHFVRIAVASAPPQRAAPPESTPLPSIAVDSPAPGTAKSGLTKALLGVTAAAILVGTLAGYLARTRPGESDFDGTSVATQASGDATIITDSQVASAKPLATWSLNTDDPGPVAQVGPGIPEPVKVHDVRLVVPEIARDLQPPGTVVVRLTIARDGRVIRAAIIRSLPLIDEAALDAVKQWRFRPTIVAGRAVPVSMEVKIEFPPR